MQMDGDTNDTLFLCLHVYGRQSKTSLLCLHRCAADEQHVSLMEPLHLVYQSEVIHMMTHRYQDPQKQ